MYRDGKGVPQEYAEAERWCRKAAEQGDARAEEGLGFLYYRGEGVPQDYGEAARWYRISAEQGDASAQYVLGYLYYYGFGVQRDRVQAYDLFQQAAANGNEDAKRALQCYRKGIQSTPVRASGAFNKSHIFILFHEMLETGNGSVDVTRRFH